MARRPEKIQARVTPGIAHRIREAAAIAGIPTSAFIVAATTDHAEAILRSQRETVVTSEYFDQLLRALDEPGKPIPALQKAFARLREHTSALE